MLGLLKEKRHFRQRKPQRQRQARFQAVHSGLLLLAAMSKPWHSPAGGLLPRAGITVADTSLVDQRQNTSPPHPQGSSYFLQRQKKSFTLQSRLLQTVTGSVACCGNLSHTPRKGKRKFLQQAGSYLSPQICFFWLLAGDVCQFLSVSPLSWLAVTKKHYQGRGR